MSPGKFGLHLLGFESHSALKEHCVQRRHQRELLVVGDAVQQRTVRRRHCGVHPQGDGLDLQDPGAACELYCKQRKVVRVKDALREPENNVEILCFLVLHQALGKKPSMRWRTPPRRYDAGQQLSVIRERPMAHVDGAFNKGALTEGIRRLASSSLAVQTSTRWTSDTCSMRERKF